MKIFNIPPQTAFDEKRVNVTQYAKKTYGGVDV
jgi:hypothetical protein